MIVQTTLTKNESFLLKEMLPLWRKYADGFVFYDDGSTDDTVEFLESVKDEYNILAIIRGEKRDADQSLAVETDMRGALFQEAKKYTNYITCLDTDEYFDGEITKEELERLLADNPDHNFLFRWIQYTDLNTIRVDGPWRWNFKDRAGSYISEANFDRTVRHSLHLPPTINGAKQIDSNKLFIAHLQWVSKKWVGVKQYYWKVTDYIHKKIHSEYVYDPTAYDASVNNFNWEYESFHYDLKVNSDIFNKQNILDNYKLQDIKKYTLKHNIPNLGDWGMGIFEFASKQTINVDISVCIVTFKEREKNVKQLITELRNTSGSNFDIILAINGNNNETFDEEYRKRMLEFCASVPRCFPICCAEFKGLPKLWNTLTIFSKTNYNLFLCDDVTLGIGDTLSQIKDYVNKTEEKFFTINGGFSHFVLTKEALHELKYFDERFIAYGEEDGDIVHQHIKTYGRSIPSFYISGMANLALYSAEFNNKYIDTHRDNKPRFNREFAKLKYKDDPNGICGMNPTPISVKEEMETAQQYPYEIFVLRNKHNISKFEDIVL